MTIKTDSQQRNERGSSRRRERGSDLRRGQSSEQWSGQSSGQGSGLRREQSSERRSDLRREQSSGQGSGRGRRGRRRRSGRPVLVFFLLSIVCFGILLYDSNSRVVISEYTLEYANLPKSFDGYRIVVLSDIHASEYGEDNGRLVAMVRDAKPDIIALTGDVIDGYDKLSADKQLSIAQILATELVKIAPVYFITGNHDWNSGELRALTSMLTDNGVTVLRNKYVILEAGGRGNNASVVGGNSGSTGNSAGSDAGVGSGGNTANAVGETIVLAGTDDPNGPADMIKPDEFVERIKRAEGDSFIVMLEHRNNNLELYSELGVDIILCGHAHGGLIRLPFTDGLLGPKRDWFPTYTSGVYTMGRSNMVVSRGIGNHTGIPRFLNNPEIVVVELTIDN